LNSSVINLKTPEQVERLRRANRHVAEILATLREVAAVGMSTLDLDRMAQDLCKQRKVRPAFLGLYGFPKSLCISLNEEVVHGIPSARRLLREGDLVSIDFGVVYEGMYGDAALSFGIGPMSELAERLMRTTEESLYLAIAQARPGNRIGDISAAVQRHAEAAGFSVIRDLVGHGVGAAPHEGPQVPNFGNPGQGVRLRAGMALALEPMVAAGNWAIDILDDGWTAVTADGSLAAHFEHSIFIAEDGPEILSQVG
jgi:methionyl aminopeptidase